MTDNPTPTNLEQDLAELANLKQQMDAARALKPKYDEVKDRVFMAMQTTRSKRTEATAGVYAVRVEKAMPTITDQEALEQYLSKTGYSEYDYLRPREIDVERIAKIARHELEDNGEIIPGYETKLVESIQIRSEGK